MSAKTEQPLAQPRKRKFRLNRLGTLTQITKALGKVIRHMANDEIDPIKGARLCFALNIQRQALESQVLERLEARLGAVMALDITPGRAIEWTSTDGYASSDSEDRRHH
jgi:hypothetical protein